MEALRAFRRSVALTVRSWEQRSNAGIGDTGYELKSPTRAHPSCCLVLMLLSACTLTPTHEESMAPLGNDVRSEIIVVNVSAVAGTMGAQHGAVQPISPGKAAGLWLLGGTAEGLSPTGGATAEPLALPLGLIVGILGAPFAAAFGSISPQDIQQAEHSLKGALTDATLVGTLQEGVVGPLRESTPYKVSEDADARLALVLYGPFLEVAKDRTAQPLLRVRGALSKSGVCLADRYWAWNGKSDDFFDLAEKDAHDLKVQLSEGVKQIGLAITQDLFLSSEARKVRYRNGTRTGKDRPFMIEKPVDYPDTLASWPTTADPAIAAPCSFESAPQAQRNRS